MKLMPTAETPIADPVWLDLNAAALADIYAYLLRRRRERLESQVAAEQTQDDSSNTGSNPDGTETF
jgi:hypothetical protein